MTDLTPEPPGRCDAPFAQPHTHANRAAAEKDKWDAYYAGLDDVRETPALEAFHEEFTARLADLLPPGASVLEAGCGAGMQSLALARTGRFHVSLMDISERALDAARRLFARSGLSAAVETGDVFAPGEPAADLVFNAGVLEHYTLDQQAAFLRGMASRSKRYVLVLVPNRLCYWYWLWRVQQSRQGNWPFGKECPMADAGAAFRKAGLTFLGRTFLAAAWTEDLIANVRGLPAAFRDEVLAVHRSGVADPAQRCYLTAALGCVGEPPARVPELWQIGSGADEMRLAEVTAGLADALALRLSGEATLRDSEQKIRELNLELSEAAAQVAAYRTFRTSGAYRLAEKILRVRAKVAPKGSWRAATARAMLHSAQTVARPVKRVAARFAPPPAGFVAVRDRIAQSGRRPYVFLPSIPWSAVLFQRPQHLAREIAKLGHTVVYDCTGTTEPDTGWVREVEPNVFVYHGPARHLAGLRNPVVWAFSYNYHLSDRFGAGATRVYDWIDDLSVFPHDPGMLRRNHARAVRAADVVASVARKLHDQLTPSRPDAVYLPNAAEFDRFARPAVRPRDPELHELLTHSSAVAGYYGALAAWFDYPLLKAVAGLLPDWGFVLIGPDYDGSIHTAGLDECHNIKWVGPRDYVSLPGYLQLFDVAIIPFAINEITLATSPLKLFEYFSGGVPVVTTPMPECVAFPEVRIAATAAEFAAALEAARAAGRSPEFRTRLQEVGRANSWAARARLIQNVVAGLEVPLLPRPARRAA